MNQRSLRRVALIGCDLDVLTLLRRGVELGQVTVSAAVECEGFAEELRQIAPETPFVREWESILDGDLADVIVFSEPRGSFLDVPEVRAEQLKKSAAAGIDLVLFHPACDGLLGYELEMARSTSHGRIITACPTIEHPTLRQLLAAMQDGHVAGVEQVIVERSGEAASRGAVLRRFAKDAMLLRELFGSPAKLSANGPAPETEDWSGLAVLLTIPEGPAVRWNLDPTGAVSGMRMTIIASSGRSQIVLDAGEEEGVFMLGGASHTARRDEAWADEVWRRTSEPREGEALEEDANWLGACRDLDLAAALQRSITRGRVVELKVDRATEAANFKGVMSAWGCLLILGVLLFFAVWSVVGALQLTWTNGVTEATSTISTDPSKVKIESNLSWRYLPVFVLAAALLGFLGLQFLQLIIRPKAKADAPEEG